MNKTNKVLIGAFLILFIGFLVNLNGNMITGKYSKDVSNEITGDGIKDITGMIAFEGTLVDISCSATCTPPFYIGLPHSCSCAAAYDGKDNTKAFGSAFYSSIKVKFNFDVTDVTKIYILPAATYSSGTMKLSDETSEDLSFSVWPEWKEVLINKPDLDSIELTIYITQGVGLSEVKIMTGPLVECIDGDGGENIYTYSDGSDISSTKEDEGMMFVFNPNIPAGWWYKTKDYFDDGICRANRIVVALGGYITKCGVSEVYCEEQFGTEGLKTKRISCPSGSPSEGGRCGCSSNDDCIGLCIDGYCGDCVDSDVTDKYPDGKNVEVRGTVTFTDGSEEDYCDVNGNLVEYYCESGLVKSYLPSLRGKCKDGAFYDPTQDVCFQFSREACISRNTLTDTACVWTNKHCCGDKEMWNPNFYSLNNGKCVTKSYGELCFDFWPKNKEEGVGIKRNEDPKKVCWNIGSMTYGFWIPVYKY